MIKISDVCRITGLTRKAVGYYEEWGLISPPQEENGYRNYGEEEVRAFQTIAALRLNQMKREGFIKAQFTRIFPGDFGKILARLYGDLLDEKLDTEEKKKAWLSLVDELVYVLQDVLAGGFKGNTPPESAACLFQGSAYLSISGSFYTVRGQRICLYENGSAMQQLGKCQVSGIFMCPGPLKSHPLH